MPVILDVLRQFDRTIWQIANPASAGGVVLLSWTVTPPPVDAGVPACVARVIAETLCSVGVVTYAGDDKDEDFRWKEEVVIRRALHRCKLALFSASSTVEVLPAFTSALHDWSMNAQWLVVTDRATRKTGIVGVVKALYEDWKLPDPWPDGLVMIVQAAVDGDGAACFSANQSVEERFMQALSDVAGKAIIELRADPHRPRMDTDAHR